MKTKILKDFQICIIVPLNICCQNRRKYNVVLSYSILRSEAVVLNLNQHLKYNSSEQTQNKQTNYFSMWIINPLCFPAETEIILGKQILKILCCLYSSQISVFRQMGAKCNVTPRDFCNCKNFTAAPPSNVAAYVIFKLPCLHLQSLSFTSTLNLGKGGRGESVSQFCPRF